MKRVLSRGIVVAIVKTSVLHFQSNHFLLIGFNICNLANQKDQEIIYANY
jgi:hypothetical protein